MTAFGLPIPALIPEYYIQDEVLRLQMYKKIAMIRNEEDESDLIDEMTDRFGDIPTDTMNLIRIARVRAMASRAGVKEINQNGYRLMLKLWETTRFGEGVIPGLVAEYGERIKFNGGSDPYIRLTVSSSKSDRTVLEELETFLGIILKGRKEN